MKSRPSLSGGLIIASYILLFLHLLCTETDSKVVQPGDPIRLSVSKTVSEQGENKDCDWTTPDYTDHTSSILKLTKGDEAIHDFNNPNAMRPPGEWTYKWFGSDSTEDCGIEISKAVEADHGKWICHFGETTEFEVLIPYPPSKTTLVNSHPQADQTDVMTFNIVEDNAPLNISCKSTKSRPEPSVKWQIGNEDIRDDVFVLKEKTPSSETFTDNEFKMTYTPDVLHDGLKLKCTFDHISKDYSQLDSTEPNAPNRFVTLSIEGPPDVRSFRFEFTQFTLGEKGILKCFFHSNPPPEKDSVMWELSGKEDPIVSAEESSSSENLLRRNREAEQYSSTLRDLGNNDFVSTLFIDNLEENHLTQEMTFRLKNKLGGASSAASPPGEPDVALSGGTIAGITVSVILAVILIGLIGVFLYKRKKTGSGESWTYNS